MRLTTAFLSSSTEPDNMISCAFYTREQCMVSISGIGGFCTQNIALPPPYAAYEAPRRVKRQHHARHD